jgi:hypothetical protein
MQHLQQQGGYAADHHGGNIAMNAARYGMFGKEADAPFEIVPARVVRCEHGTDFMGDAVPDRIHENGS